MTTPINPVTEASKAGSFPARRFNKRERKLVQSVEVFAPAVAGNWAAQPTTIKGALDQLALQSGPGTRTTVKATYNFATNGGAVSTISLGVTIPQYAIITGVLTDVVTAFTGTAGGTIQLELATDGALAPALVYNQGTGPVGEDYATAATVLPLKTTVSQLLGVTLATHAVTAGKAYFWVTYIQGTLA